MAQEIHIRSSRSGRQVVCEHAAVSPEQEIIGPAFVTKSFIAALFTCILTGALLGLLCIGYIKAITKIPAYWYTADNDGYPNESSTLTWAAGKPWWIAVGAATGLLEGSIKAATGMDEFPSFLKELQEREVEAWMSLRVFALTLISMFGGASLGPEAGLGAIGSLTGQTAAWLMHSLSLGIDVDAKDLTSVGAAAALAPMLPSPYLSILLVVEISGLPTPRTAALMFAACTSSFAVYWSLMPHTYLEATQLALFARESRAATKYDFAIGILFGVMGAVLTLIYFIVGGLVKNVFAVFKRLLDGVVGSRVRVLLLCTLSGVLFGTFNYVFPLTLGSGNEMLTPVVQSGTQLSSGLLVASSAAKMLSFWVCSSGGLVGGVVFPMLLIGTMMGSVMSDWTGVHRYLAINCSFAVVCAAFLRFPSTWIFLTFVAFTSNVQVLFPIFAAVFTANLLFAGVGVPQWLLAKSQQRTATAQLVSKDTNEAGEPTPSSSVALP